MDKDAVLHSLETLGNRPLVRHVVGKPVWHASRMIWKSSPERVRQTAPFKSFGHLIHRLSRMRHTPFRSEFTRFMRNRPLYQTICDEAAGSNFDPPIRLAVFACSTGAEVFSIRWMLSQLVSSPIKTIGSDISQECVEACRTAQYAASDERLDGLSRSEKEAMFDVHGDMLVVKPSIQSDIDWMPLDISDANLVSSLGPQHIVVANHVLIHMSDEVAESSFRNLASIVMPGGLLCITGVSLDVRTHVARALKLQPIKRRIREIHHGYLPILSDWPCEYWGLEPYDASHPDHDYRYVSLFRVSGDI